VDQDNLAHKPARVQRLRLIVSVLAIGLVALAALLVPRVIQMAHAAPKPANTCAQPPAGKDLTTMSSQQLKGYGLPPRLPGQSHAQWASMVRHARHRFCFPHSAAPSGSAQHALMRPLSARDVPSCGTCFAGLEGDTSSGDGMSEVYGNVVVPCPSGTGADGPVAAWVGLGSPGGGGPFLRVGVELTQSTGSILIGRNWVTTTQFLTSAFIQDTSDPTNPGFQLGPTFDCGETVALQIYHSDNDPTSHQWNLYFFGETSGNYFNVQRTSSPDTSAAECMVEDPNNGALPMLDFGTINYTYCVATVFGGEFQGLTRFSPNRQWDMTYDQGYDDPAAFVVNVHDVASDMGIASAFDVVSGIFCAPPPVAPGTLC
jgi:hypothetical protein